MDGCSARSGTFCSRLVQIETSRGSTAAHQHMQKHQGDGAPDECSAISKQQKQIQKLARCKSETKWDGERKLFIHFFLNQKRSSL